MREDFWLFTLVFLVWAALTLLYTFAPMLAMPGAVMVWGLGALLFLTLAVLLLMAE
ncbi:MAG: hypothetical protein U1F68_11795 [Gammaproteobacteria bacterium]